ncbi:MAG: hypothetical protein MR269_05255 [Clostridiales bacterium]|nr:hypothetical protein [Clostridiales bacterium]
MIHLTLYKIFKKFLNKKGSEMVEATMVLPIVILIILGLLCFLVFFFRASTMQYRQHRESIDNSNESGAVFEINRTEYSYSRSIKSINQKTYKSGKWDRIYVLNEESILRIGGIAVDLFED